MRYTFAFLAALAAVEASPVPQGVTMAMSPSAAAPSGCMPTYSGSFGIAVMNITGSAAAVATQSAEYVNPSTLTYPTSH